MPRSARLVALAALLAAATETRAPRAAEQEPTAGAPLPLDVIGGCPDAGAVRALLARLVSPDEVRDAAASIQDQGAHYRIAVRGAATTLDDPARDCGARARQAAVAIADALRSHPTVFGPPTWTVEKGAVFDFAPGAPGSVWAPGAEMRGAVGSGRWSLVGAAGARGPATLTFDDRWRAELLRFPLDLGGRITLYWGRFRPWLVLGGSLTPTAFLGQDLVETDRQWRLDLGALLMVGATLRLFGRVGVATAFNLRWQPRPYHLQVAPTGQVGETPALWLGMSFNYTLDGKASSP